MFKWKIYQQTQKETATSKCLKAHNSTLACNNTYENGFIILHQQWTIYASHKHASILHLGHSEEQQKEEGWEREGGREQKIERQRDRERCV